jgi:hypothetical protein
VLAISGKRIALDLGALIEDLAVRARWAALVHVVVSRNFNLQAVLRKRWATTWLGAISADWATRAHSAIDVCGLLNNLLAVRLDWRAAFNRRTVEASLATSANSSIRKSDVVLSDNLAVGRDGRALAGRRTLALLAIIA